MSVTQRPAYGPPPEGPPYAPHPTPWPYGPPVPARRRSNAATTMLLVALVLVVAAAAVAGAYILMSSGDESIEGDGYSYEVPDGWSDLTGTEGTAGLDTVSGVGENLLDGTEGVVVGITARPSATDPESLRELGAQSLSGLPGASGVEAIDDATVDGRRAIGVRASYLRPETGAHYVMTTHVVVDDDRVYTLSYSSKGGAESHDLETFGQVLDSWDWEQA